MLKLNYKLTIATSLLFYAVQDAKTLIGTAAKISKNAMFASIT